MGDRKDHVLIIEDDMATLYALNRLFQGSGWQVSSCRTIEEALMQLEPPPDWIVLDLGLNNGNGEAVLRYVREAGIPSRVAVVSGLIGPESLSGLKPWMPDVLLTKPISFEDLLRACAAPASRQLAHKTSTSDPLPAGQKPLAAPGEGPVEDRPG